MRVKCHACGARFDIPIRAVLAEAERIKNKKSAVPGPSPDVNGNLLSPQELAEKRAREVDTE